MAEFTDDDLRVLKSEWERLRGLGWLNMQVGVGMLGGLINRMLAAEDALRLYMDSDLPQAIKRWKEVSGQGGTDAG